MNRNLIQATDRKSVVNDSGRTVYEAIACAGVDGVAENHVWSDTTAALELTTVSRIGNIGANR